MVFSDLFLIVEFDERAEELKTDLVAVGMDSRSS